MKTNTHTRNLLTLGLSGLAVIVGTFTIADAHAHPFQNRRDQCNGSVQAVIVYEGDGPQPAEIGGSWYWMRSPEEEKRVVAGLFNKYCIRCHGVDGRGVWDIPGVPNFTNNGWQASRSDAQIARIVIEGRGAVMPPFRGALTLEESWAMARYLRSFIPGAQAPRPDFGQPEKTGDGQQKPDATKPAPAKEGTEPKKPEAKQPVTFGRK